MLDKITSEQQTKPAYFKLVTVKYFEEKTLGVLNMKV